MRDGENQPDMPQGMNDKISSVRIFGNTSVMVFQDSRFEGRSTRFDYDVPDLRREGWNDLVSSIRVGGAWGHSHGGYGNGRGNGNGHGNGIRQRQRQRLRVRQRRSDDHARV